MSDNDSAQVNGETDDSVSGAGVSGHSSYRREYLRNGGLAVAASVGLAGCSGGGSTVGSSQNYEVVKLITTPGNQPANTRKQWEPLINYLLAEVDGLEMEISFAQNYSAVGQALLNDQGHLTSGDVVLLANPDEFDVIGIRSNNGSAVYFSMMVTLPEYDIDERTDVKGKTVAFADRLSTSGSLFATWALQDAGLDIGGAPYGDPVDYDGEWSNHDAAKKSLFNREDVVAATTYGGNIMPNIPKEQFPDRVRERSSNWDDTVGTESPQADLVWTSPPIPSSPMIMPSAWEHPLRTDIEQALIDIEPGTLEEPEDVEVAITAIKEGGMEDYEPVQKVITDLEVDFSDL